MQAKGKVKENTQKTRQEGTGMYRTGQYGRGKRGEGGESQSMSSHKMVGITNGRQDFDSLACLRRGTRKEVCAVRGEGSELAGEGRGSKLLPKLRLPRMWTVINELSAVPDKSGIH